MNINRESSDILVSLRYYSFCSYFDFFIFLFSLLISVKVLVILLCMFIILLAFFMSM